MQVVCLACHGANLVIYSFIFIEGKCCFCSSVDADSHCRNGMMYHKSDYVEGMTRRLETDKDESFCSGTSSVAKR